MIKIGVLGLQGAIEEHEESLRKAADELNTDIEIVRLVLPEQLKEIDGIVIPGGESTAMKLIGTKNGMLKKVKSSLDRGMPAFGTCAGAILLSKKVKKTDDSEPIQGTLPVLDIEILRNGYGRQKDSFSTDLSLKSKDKPFHGIFIRAPIISNTKDNVEILAEYDNHPVFVKQNNLFATSFHPELTKDTRIHNLFLKFIIENK